MRLDISLLCASEILHLRLIQIDTLDMCVVEHILVLSDKNKNSRLIRFVLCSLSDREMNI